MYPYSETARNLQEESGYTEDENVVELRKAIETCRWDHAEQIILPMCGRNGQRVKFLLRREHFLELLEARQVMDALHVLRNDLTPISTNKDELHSLSRQAYHWWSGLMCSYSRESGSW